MSDHLGVTAGATIWITGLPAAGKTTLAGAVADAVAAAGRRAIVLDGDAMRSGLNADLGYSTADRAEVTRRLGEVALVLAQQGHEVVVASISPSAAARAGVRRRHEEGGVSFCEVFVDVPVEECERRDPKGLYAAARRGEVSEFTGVSSPYDRPQNPEIVVNADVAPEVAAKQIVRRVVRPQARRSAR